MPESKIRNHIAQGSSDVAVSWYVRPATLSDISALVGLRRLMFEEMGYREAAALDAMAAASERYFAATLPTGEFRGWVAEAMGKVVASGGLVIRSAPPTVANLDGREGYIMSVATNREWRQRGIATAILAAILEHLRDAGISWASLRASEEGQPLYARLGFAPSHEMRLHLPGEQ